MAVEAIRRSAGTLGNGSGSQPDGGFAVLDDQHRAHRCAIPDA